MVAPSVLINIEGNALHLFLPTRHGLAKLLLLPLRSDYGSNISPPVFFEPLPLSSGPNLWDF